jgi:hypothetical protein
MEENQNIPEIQLSENQQTNVAYGLKREWTSYFKEFLMLFLAISLGFYADNLREEYSDANKQKEYIQSMYEDLKDDTLTYSTFIKSTEKQNNNLKALYRILTGHETNDKLDSIYFLARTSTMKYTYLFPNTRTFLQMKSSGHLRLINDIELSDAVSSYYNSLENIHFQNQFIKSRVEEYWNIMEEMFDAEILMSIRTENKLPAKHNLKLLKDDRLTINRFMVRAQYMDGTRLFQKEQAISSLTKAEALLHLINKKYNLN